MYLHEYTSGWGGRHMGNAESQDQYLELESGGKAYPLVEGQFRSRNRRGYKCIVFPPAGVHATAKHTEYDEPPCHRHYKFSRDSLGRSKIETRKTNWQHSWYNSKQSLPCTRLPCLVKYSCIREKQSKMEKCNTSYALPYPLYT